VLLGQRGASGPGADDYTVEAISRGHGRLPVVLFNVQGVPSASVAALLAERGIIVRGGYHCSSMSHHALGTLAIGGAVRVSPGHDTTPADMDTFIEAVTIIAGQACPQQRSAL
jgi:selenocysteine lyase/cysteine desulfurase